MDIVDLRTRERKILARESEQNAAVSRAASRAHLRRLVDAVRSILHGGDPRQLRAVAATAIAAGLPVRSDALFAPPEVLECEARYLCLALPMLSSFHADARLWLGERQKRDPQSFEGAIPWNIALGGSLVNEDDKE